MPLDFNFPKHKVWTPGSGGDTDSFIRKRWHQGFDFSKYLLAKQGLQMTVD